MFKVILVVTLSSAIALVPPPPRSAQAELGIPQNPLAAGYLNLHKRDGGLESSVEFELYSSGHGLETLAQVRSFLESFRKLTNEARGRFSQRELDAFGGATSGDTQIIGFQNLPLVIEGTILKQEYQLRQAQYELARLRRDRGEIAPVDLDRARTLYEEATKQFQTFWDTRLPTI